MSDKQRLEELLSFHKALGRDSPGWQCVALGLGWSPWHMGLYESSGRKIGVGHCQPIQIKLLCKAQTRYFLVEMHKLCAQVLTESCSWHREPAGRQETPRTVTPLLFLSNRRGSFPRQERNLSALTSVSMRNHLLALQKTYFFC